MGKESESGLGATLDFMRLLWALDHGLQRRSKRMELELGVTGPQRISLRLIGRFPGVAPSRLAELLFLHRSTMTGILRRLELRGLAERLADPDDGRRARFELTARGREVDGMSAGTVEAAVRRALSRVSEADQQVAREVLEVVVTELSRGDR